MDLLVHLALIAVFHVLREVGFREKSLHLRPAYLTPCAGFGATNPKPAQSAGLRTESSICYMVHSDCWKLIEPPCEGGCEGLRRQPSNYYAVHYYAGQFRRACRCNIGTLLLLP